MLKGMEAREKEEGIAEGTEEWSVYILRCGDESLYTGIAKDVAKRLKQHSDGKGARYTRTRLPLSVVYQESCSSRTRALVREYELKKLPRAKKLEIIEVFAGRRPARPARRLRGRRKAGA